MENPQSLNIYSYVKNNPLTDSDEDGHVPCGGSATITIIVNGNGSSSMSQSADDCPKLGLWDTFLWHRRQFINQTNRRINAHRPPPQKPNGTEALQDINNIMMGGASCPV